MRVARITLLVALACTSRVAAAADPPATAAAGPPPFTRVDRVPDDRQRAFNSDRPSVTTSPFTVDAGHAQLEASFGQYTRDRSETTGGDGGEHVAVLPAEVRVGVTDRVEVDVMATPFLLQHTPAGIAVRPTPTTPRVMTAAAHNSGFGDVQLQAKLNLFGDDGGDQAGDTALGLVPYLTLPTASSTKGLGTGRVQGGVAVPVQATLPAGFTLAGMAQFDCPRNDANTTTGFDCLHTVELSHPIVGPLDAYAEYVGVAPVRLGHGYQAYVDAGLTLQVGDNVQLDVGVNLGRSRDTPAYAILAGFAVRR